MSRRVPGLNQLGPPPRVPTSNGYHPQMWAKVREQRAKLAGKRYPFSLLPHDHPAMVEMYTRGMLKAHSNVKRLPRRKVKITLAPIRGTE